MSTKTETWSVCSMAACVTMHMHSRSIPSVYLSFSGNTLWPVTHPRRNLFYSRHIDAIRDKCPSTFSPNSAHIQPWSELQLKAAHPSKLSGGSLKLGFCLSAITCFPLSFLPIYRSISSSYLSLTHLSFHNSTACHTFPISHVFAYVSQQIDTDRIHYRDIYALPSPSQNNEFVLRKPNSSWATRTIETVREGIGGREVEDEKGQE